jgi:hypothetical protein
MYPRSFDAFVLLRGLVRSLPIALAIPPQPNKSASQPGWRLGRGEHAEFVEGHFRRGLGRDDSLSSNLARKKRRLEGNMETGETPAEETKIAKPLKTQDFPITVEDFC